MPKHNSSHPFTPFIKNRPFVAYHPRWNQLTGSPLATLLLRQILYHWLAAGRRPFYKHVAPCPSAPPGRSWLEELGFTIHQFRAARDRIARKITTGDSRHDALQASLVIYWTEDDRRTGYEVNEPLLLRRLAQLEGNPDTPNSENRIYMSKSENRTYMVTPESAVTCTNKEMYKKDPSMDQELVNALARLGDTHPRDLVTRYPAAEIRHWLDYCQSPLAANIYNKPGFIRYKLDETRHPPPPVSPAPPAARPDDADTAASAPQRLWATILADLQLQLDRPTFTHYLTPTHALDLVDGTLRVAAPDAHIRDWLDHRLRPAIQKTLTYFAGDLSIEFILHPPEP